MIKLFISDLDGTLIHKAKKNLEPNEENVKAVKILKENNVEFAIATGRLDKHILEVEKHVDSKNYRIGVNGGTIYDKENNLILENAFEFKDIKNIKEELEKNYIKQINFMVLLTTKGQRYIKYSNILKRMVCFYGYEKKFKALLYLESLLEELESSNIKIIKVLINTKKEKKYTLEKEFKEKFNGFEVAISGPHSIEIGPKENNKGRAIQIIMEKEKLTRDEVAFIGDSYNDLSAFKVCEYSFAMSHADDKIKSKAKYVVESVAEAVTKVVEFNNN